MTMPLSSVPPPRPAGRLAGLPVVVVNMAMTADGKIATANRAVSSFGSGRDHDNLLRLRSTADAVMAGARTVDLNHVNLGPGPIRFRRLREARGLAPYNLRVIVSGSGTVNPLAEVFRHNFSPIIILTTGRASAARQKRLRALADDVRVCGPIEIDFRSALAWLRRKWGVRRLVCEGGGELNAALIRLGLVQELHLTICPKIVGGRSAPTICDGIGAPTLALTPKFRLRESRRCQNELFLVYTLDRS